MYDTYIDLHVHSNKSDGTLSPESIVSLAVEKKLSAIALTDHDTVSGLPGAQAAARSYGIELVPGIELSTEYDGNEVHILGYYIDDKNPAFLSKLETFQFSRDIRNKKMVEKLQSYGFHISLPLLKQAYGKRVLTRAHFARYLVDKGYVKDMGIVFQKYLGNHCCCYVPREKITPYKAIDLIRTGGGAAYFAHPVLCHMNQDYLNDFISSLKEHGLTGLEAIYSTYTTNEERNMLHLAQKHGLLISGGSDFHGSNKSSIQLGSGKGGLRIPYIYLQQLKNQLYA